MLDFPLSAGTKPAAVRRPTFAIDFGSGSGGAGGLLESAGSALGLAGGSDDPWSAATVSITIELSLAPEVDVAILHLANEARAPQVAIGDTGTIELGYADDESVLVFTGQVDAVGSTLAGTTRVTVVNSGAKLARRRLNQSYQQQAAGAIVQDLLGQAGVSGDSVEDGIEYPFYVIDAAHTLYQHIASLAHRSGFVAYITPEDKVNFAPAVAENAEQSFVYGQDIVAAYLTDAAPAVTGVKFTGEGAAGSQGTDAWAWLVKDATAIQKSKGAVDLPLLVADPALRSGSAIETAAAAHLDAQVNAAGYLVAPGAPAITAGKSIEITGAPQAALNGLFLVRHVRHSYDKYGGFQTRAYFGKAGASTSSPLNLPGGLP